MTQVDDEEQENESKKRRESEMKGIRPKKVEIKSEGKSKIWETREKGIRR